MSGDISSTIKLSNFWLTPFYKEFLFQVLERSFVYFFSGRISNK